MRPNNLIAGGLAATALLGLIAILLLATGCATTDGTGPKVDPGAIIDKIDKGLAACRDAKAAECAAQGVAYVDPSPDYPCGDCGPAPTPAPTVAPSVEPTPIPIPTVTPTVAPTVAPTPEPDVIYALTGPRRLGPGEPVTIPIREGLSSWRLTMTFNDVDNRTSGIKVDSPLVFYKETTGGGEANFTVGLYQEGAGDERSSLSIQRFNRDGYGAYPDHGERAISGKGTALRPDRSYRLTCDVAPLSVACVVVDVATGGQVYDRSVSLPRSPWRGGGSLLVGPGVGHGPGLGSGMTIDSIVVTEVE